MSDFASKFNLAFAQSGGDFNKFLETAELMNVKPGYECSEHIKHLKSVLCAAINNYTTFDEDVSHWIFLAERQHLFFLVRFQEQKK